MRDTGERAAKRAMRAELLVLEGALNDFLKGGVSEGLITPFKMLLLVHARTVLAVARIARAGVRTTKIR